MPAGQERRQTLNAVRSEHATTTTAKMTSCRAHRKLYAQDILIDLMELQIKFAGFAVITTDAIATDRHFPDESRYGFRNPLCVITKLDAVSAVTQLPRPGLIWSCPELEHYIAEVLDAFQGDHFSYVGEADHGGRGYTRVPRHPGQQIPHRGLHLHTSIPQPPRPRPPLYA